MKIAVFASFRAELDGDGQYWTSSSVGYDFWTRYLAVFDEVELVIRVKDDLSPSEKRKKVSGPGVRVVPLPDYHGAMSWFPKLRTLRGAISDSLEPARAVSFRLPCDAAFIAGRQMRQQGRPYGVEVVGDPYDVLAPNAVRHPLRPILRRIYTRQQQGCVKGAVGAAYVTESHLQARYPAPAAAMRTHFSSVELNDQWFAGNYRKNAISEQQGAQLIFVGSLDQPYKALDVLLDALAMNRSVGLEVKLTVVGDGMLRGALEDRARRLGLSPRVQFCGQVHGDERVRQLLQKADLFVLPSRTEGLPRAVIEAMAQGLPCIGTTVGGIPELLPAEDLVPPNDAEALASKIAEVLGNPKRMSVMSARNLRVAADYRNDVLRERRIAFYQYVREQTEEWLYSKGRA